MIESAKCDAMPRKNYSTARKRANNELEKAAGSFGYEMEKTYLIQRLLPPYEGTGLLAMNPNPFAFGGGLRNGGLSDNAMKILGQAFQFDYMGSAEFEFGAVPKALSKILNYVNASECTVGTVRLGIQEVYFLSSKRQENYVRTLLPLLYKDEYDVNLKEYCLLRESVNDEHNYRNVRGWIELDNGFMFFSDKKMFQNTCEILGIRDMMIEKLHGTLSSIAELKKSAR